LFNSIGSILGFLAGVLLTVGLLLSPHLIPGERAYGIALHWPAWQIAAAAVIALAILLLALKAGGILMRGARCWKQPRAIAAILLIAFIANDLYVCLVDFFALKAGLRALVAVLGVPVIYGNISATLGNTSLKTAMLNLFTGALTTMGAGFIIAALIRGW
jgi:hypothetical protein